jgi:Holliday junction DNA helicase RuvA
MVRPIKEVANAIQRQDAKWLTTLPGVGAQTAEKIIATLRRKVTRFAMLGGKPEAAPASAGAAEPGEVAPTPPVVEGSVIEDAYQALLSIGHSPVEARDRLDKVYASGKAFATVEEVLLEIYKQK